MIGILYDNVSYKKTLLYSEKIVFTLFSAQKINLKKKIELKNIPTLRKLFTFFFFLDFFFFYKL